MAGAVSAVSGMYRFCKKLGQDSVNAFSAQAAFFIILSFFPFAMFLLTLLQYMPISEELLSSLAIPIVPAPIMNFVEAVLNEIYAKASGAVVSITLITTLWSASKGIFAIIHGFQSVYGTRETRNYLTLRLAAIGYTLLFIAVLVVTLVILVFGNSLSVWLVSRFPHLGGLTLLVLSLRTVTGLAVLTVFFLLLYTVVPNQKQRLLQQLPGALFSACGWMAFSYLYSYYIDHMGSFSYLYGSLTAVVLLMLWLYCCMYLMFVGAEVNVWLQTKRR